MIDDNQLTSLMSLYFVRYDSSFLRHIETVQELSDILVFDSRGLLYKGGRAGDIFNRIAFNDQLVLLFCGVDNSYPWCHLYPPDVFLSQEITDLNYRVTFRCDTVDGEMGIYSTHFVLETLCHA